MPQIESQPELRILLDENMPLAVAAWLRRRRPHWEVFHILGLGLQRSADHDVFNWAQVNGCVIVTFDRSFADRRSLGEGDHCGVVRLRVRPTTEEEVERALGRLLDEVPDQELMGALVIVGRDNIRVRHRRMPDA